MKSGNYIFPPPADSGQGLVEYALILTLVAVVVIITLNVLGSAVSNVFCQVNAGLSGANPIGCDVQIMRADYDSQQQTLHLDARVGGTYDPTIQLTLTPGGPMQGRPSNSYYHITGVHLTGCPCTVKVTSNVGGSATVTVGP